MNFLYFVVVQAFTWRSNVPGIYLDASMQLRTGRNQKWYHFIYFPFYKFPCNYMYQKIYLDKCPSNNQDVLEWVMFTSIVKMVQFITMWVGISNVRHYHRLKYIIYHTEYALREEILAGRNFGGFSESAQKFKISNFKSTFFWIHQN